MSELKNCKSQNDFVCTNRVSLEKTYTLISQYIGRLPKDGITVFKQSARKRVLFLI